MQAHTENRLPRLAYYDCRLNATQKPGECDGVDCLAFQFVYEPVSTLSPYGEILYNYAAVTTGRGIAMALIYSSISDS